VAKKLGHTGRRERKKCIFLVQDKMPPCAAKPQGLHMRWALSATRIERSFTSLTEAGFGLLLQGLFRVRA